MSRVLIAEDDPHVAAFIEKGLRADGFVTMVTEDGASAERLSLGGEYDLLILDIRLSGRDGFSVLQTLRSCGAPIQILVLTAHFELRGAAAYLDAGADDYLAKPFRFDELLARVRARLRRPIPPEPPELEAGGVHLDPKTLRATVDGAEVELTRREGAVLEMFLRHPRQILSREQLLSSVWGYDFDPRSNVVNVYVNVLRRKLGADVIDTVRGAGYRLRKIKSVSPSPEPPFTFA